MDMSSLTLGDDVPGVFAARQKRSIRIRDKYLEAGVELLNSMRFSDLRVSDLAKKCGGSVGSFYTRFQDKEAYFRALRSATIIACNKEIDKRVNLDRLYEMETGEAMDELVDLMADVYTSPLRGVLRESLLRILDPEDPWEPMRASARNIMFNYRRALSNEIEGFAEEEAGPRLNFCFQLIVGALQNDLVNDYHVFSTRDESLRQGLKEAVRAYLRLPVLAS
jgi:AcrR family transcriptional regulator